MAKKKEIKKNPKILKITPITPNKSELKYLLLHTEKLNMLNVGLLKSCVRRVLVSHSCIIEAEFINGVTINERGERL